MLHRRYRRKKKTLPQALSEDLQKVKENWGYIVSSLPGMLKTCAKQINPAVENGKLLLVVDEGLFLDMLNDEENKAELKRAIDERVGRDVSFEVRELPQNRSFDSVYSRLLDKSKINFDIIDEDEVIEEDAKEPDTEEKIELLESGDGSVDASEDEEEDEREEFLEESELDTE